MRFCNSLSSLEDEHNFYYEKDSSIIKPRSKVDIKVDIANYNYYSVVLNLYPQKR